MFRKFITKTKYVFAVPLNQSVFGYTIDDLLPDNPTGFDTLGEFISSTISLVIGIAGLLAVIILIYNGIMYIVSGGDEGKVEKATKGITYAIIGLILCFISIIVVDFVMSQILRSTIV